MSGLLEGEGVDRRPRRPGRTVGDQRQQDLGGRVGVATYGELHANLLMYRVVHVPYGTCLRHATGYWPTPSTTLPCTWTVASASAGSPPHSAPATACSSTTSAPAKACSSTWSAKSSGGNVKRWPRSTALTCPPRSRHVRCGDGWPTPPSGHTSGCSLNSTGRRCRGAHTRWRSWTAWSRHGSAR